MSPFQTFSAAVWPALLLLVLTPAVDATRARRLLKSAKTTRRLIHVNKQNGTQPLDYNLAGQNMYMLSHLAGEGEGKELGCHPRCVWHCTDPVCDKTCEPVCEAPKCETRCPNEIDKKFCQQTCGEPDCLVLCKKNQDKCTTQECPDPCEIQCKEPQCKMQCEAPVCHSICEDPHCEWTCKDPENCPKPQCAMQCEQPKGCIGKNGVINPLPENLDTYIKSQAVAKLEGVSPLQDAKPK